MSVKIIAEIGWNHMGDMVLAEDMIRAASESGADMVKFQYWDPKFLRPGPWDDDGRIEIYRKAALDSEKIQILQKISSENNVEFLISVFGTIGAKFIKDLDIEIIKIPSHETINIDLINFCAKNFNYVYFSGGASLKGEIEEANEILKKGSCEYNLMHCVSSYPCGVEFANIKRILWLKELSANVGFSDHTDSSVVPAIAVSLGATVIEKHFTTDKNLPGRDNKFAFEPREFKEMSENIRLAESSIIDRGIDFQEIERDTVENYRGRWEPADYE